jgi:2-succinyl-5-enolpyruvyl-6-hydroxy-3-cyclohexene-1-carboxylate synthase
MAFDKILKQIPDTYMLQSGNSSTIRYLQLFDLNKTLTVFCNRGTSGIDGSTSTAIGAATVSENPTVFITGDLSFFYDSNALWNNYTPSNFRIIIINNRGGGIFRILPGNKNSKNFSTFFETNHDLTAEPISKLFNFEYTSASSNEELETALENFYIQSSRPKLLEIFTPSSENDQILLSYFDFIK